MTFYKTAHSLLGKPEGERPLGRPRSKRVNNINMALRRIGSYGMDWTGLNWIRILTFAGSL
jgi:hypothetical protein